MLPLFQPQRSLSLEGLGARWVLGTTRPVATCPRGPNRTREVRLKLQGAGTHKDVQHCADGNEKEHVASVATDDRPNSHPNLRFNREALALNSEVCLLLGPAARKMTFTTTEIQKRADSSAAALALALERLFPDRSLDVISSCGRVFGCSDKRRAEFQGGGPTLGRHVHLCRTAGGDDAHRQNLANAEMPNSSKSIQIHLNSLPLSDPDCTFSCKVWPSPVLTLT